MHLDDNSDSDRPTTPSEEDCCHNGCQPCIFEVHLKLVENWQKKKQKDQIQRNNLLQPTVYKNFTISDISTASSDCILFCLKYKDEEKDNEGIRLYPSQYVMINAWSSTRPYTPISWTNNSLVFLVKHYKNGIFTSKLREAKIGDIVNVRGPYGEFDYKRNSFRQIMMFSIGSGIAAMYPMAKKIVEDDLEETWVHLVSGFRTINHVPLTKELQTLSDYWNFKCTLHFSQVHANIMKLHGLDIKYGRLDKPSVSDYLLSVRQEVTLILICGTLDFNQSVKEWARGMNFVHVHVFS